jgi:HPt (histidine-containing phosphotransfer) domain-containing protein
MPRPTKPARLPTAAASNGILEELRAAVDAADLQVILSVFKSDVEAQLNDLKDFVTAGKADAARRVAHRLAGLLAQFGAIEASERSHRMAATTRPPATEKDVAGLVRACEKAVAEICAFGAVSPMPATPDRVGTDYVGAANVAPDCAAPDRAPPDRTGADRAAPPHPKDSTATRPIARPQLPPSAVLIPALKPAKRTSTRRRRSDGVQPA